MKICGELLTAEERQQARAHFCKNDGKKWDLHEMAVYIQKGYDAVEADAKASAQLRDGMECLRQGRQHG